AELVLPAGFATLGGNFAFEISNSDANQIKVAATELHLDIMAGSNTVASFNHGSGAFVINSAGVAGTATLQFQAGMIGASGSIGLEINTTSAAVNTSITTPTGPATINLPTPNYLKISVNGNLRIGSVTVPMNFYIVVSGGVVQFWRTSPNGLLVS